MIGCFGIMPGKAGTIVRLPPPLRGRAGERGKPRALTEDTTRDCINELNTMDWDAGVVLALRQAIEQAAPLSLTLPRKGRGNASTNAFLTSPVATRVQAGLFQ
jgi:hypothetical protein